MIDAIMNAAPAWAQTHAAPLLVMVPLFLAPLLALVPSGRVAWLISIAATGISFLFSLILLGLVQTSPIGVVSYEIGNWEVPLGIELRVDALNAMILLIVTTIGLLASIFSWPTVTAEVPKVKRSLFYSAFLVCFAGLNGVAITGDAFNLFVFLEISSISTYVLVALGSSRDRRALPAAFNYLIMGTIGASFYIIGIGFLYAATGTLNMYQISTLLPELAGHRSVQAGFAFILVGLGLKAAMWPLHQWLPNAYSYSPSFVTMFLSATATKVALYALIRFLFTVFRPDYGFEISAFSAILMPLGHCRDGGLQLPGCVPDGCPADPGLFLGCAGGLHDPRRVHRDNGGPVGWPVPPGQSRHDERRAVHGGRRCGSDLPGHDYT